MRRSPNTLTGAPLPFTSSFIAPALAGVMVLCAACDGSTDAQVADGGDNPAGAGGAAGAAGTAGMAGAAGTSGVGSAGSAGSAGEGGGGGSGQEGWGFEFLEDAGDGWQVLLVADWEVPAGTETYRCAHFTVPNDVSLVRFKPLSPPGTHHATMGVFETASVADGITTCGVGSGGDRRLMGSGVGTDPSDPFPEGVAMELRAGNQLSMNLHLFNVGDETLSGRSGVLVQVGERATPELQASTVLAGPLSLSIPPGNSVQQGSCTFPSAATIFAVAPHMHQLGVHLEATALRGGQDPLVLFDAPYDFDRQVGNAIEPIEMAAGDRLEVKCTYQNDTDGTVRWGDSSLDEMCFASLAFYPANAFGSRPCTF